MNIAITNGLVLMPPAFRGGLNAWSTTNGTPGSPTWGSADNGALVPADQDFGTCLEVMKQQTTTSVRFKGETPATGRAPAFPAWWTSDGPCP